MTKIREIMEKYKYTVLKDGKYFDEYIHGKNFDKLEKELQEYIGSIKNTWWEGYRTAFGDKI